MLNNNSSSPAVIKVAIADDHSIFRAGLRSSLSQHKNLRFVSEAENGMQLLDLFRANIPDVLLLDLTMPVMDGMTTLKKVKQLYPAIKVIILSEIDDEESIASLMAAEANSYLNKRSSGEEIYEAISVVSKNEWYFNDLVNKALLSSTRSKNHAMKMVRQGVNLIEKEITVLKLMCSDKSTKEIADIMQLSPRTVESLRVNMYPKTGTRTMVGLAIFAVQTGLVKIELEKV